MVNYLPTDDKACLIELEKGNEEALAMLMKEHYADLYDYAFRFCKDKEMVKDCIQEIFFSLWKCRHTASNIVSLRFS